MQRLPSSIPLTCMEKEWIKCPRCKTVDLKPNVMSRRPDGCRLIWWTCENYQNCDFPLDMPPDVYQVEQTPEQVTDGFYPLPNIYKLPEKYKHLYPLTFTVSLMEYRSRSAVRFPTCNSAVSHGPSGSDCVSVVSSSVSNDLRFDNENNATDPSLAHSCELPSTSSGPENSTGTSENDDIDKDIDIQVKKPMRMLKRRKGHESNRSWRKLIENLAKDNEVCKDLLSMDEARLVSKMETILSDSKQREDTNVSFTRKTRRTTYKIDEIEAALRQCPDAVDWEVAREKMENVKNSTLSNAKSGRNILNAFGMDPDPVEYQTILKENEKKLSERVERIMKKIMAPACDNQVETNDAKNAKRPKFDLSTPEENSRESTSSRISSIRAKISQKLQSIGPSTSSREPFCPPTFELPHQPTPEIESVDQSHPVDEIYPMLQDWETNLDIDGDFGASSSSHSHDHQQHQMAQPYVDDDDVFNSYTNHQSHETGYQEENFSYALESGYNEEHNFDNNTSNIDDFFLEHFGP